MVTQPTYPAGSSLVYLCDMGFGTRDDVVTECQDTTFTWTLDNNPPTCIRSKRMVIDEVAHQANFNNFELSHICHRTWEEYVFTKTAFAVAVSNLKLQGNAVMSLFIHQ